MNLEEANKAMAEEEAKVFRRWKYMARASHLERSEAGYRNADEVLDRMKADLVVLERQIQKIEDQVPEEEYTRAANQVDQK